MSFGLIIVLAAIVVLAAVAVVARLKEDRTRDLRASYGPEYQRLVAELGGRRAADRELSRRRKVHDRLDLRPVGADELRAFTESWEHVQGGFLDDPVTALDNASHLVDQALDARGFPAGTTKDRIVLASVEDGRILGDFREATTVCRQTRADRDQVSTESLRVALTQYRDTFDHLLGNDGLAVARHDQD